MIQNTPNSVTLTNGNGCEIHAVNHMCQQMSQNKCRILDPHKIRIFFSEGVAKLRASLDKSFTCYYRNSVTILQVVRDFFLVTDELHFFFWLLHFNIL